MSVAYLCVTRNRGERPQPLFQQVTCMNKQSAEISAPQTQDIAKKKCFDVPHNSFASTASKQYQ